MGNDADSAARQNRGRTMAGYLIGLDYGTESARGILLNAQSGAIEASHTHAYRHHVLTRALPDRTLLPPAWALQVATDYTEAAAAILGALGRDKPIDGIGLGFTASTPLPARADGTPLSTLYPSEPHAYVKLWKHQAAQPWADRINARGGEFLRNFGGKVSGEWLLAKAAQLGEEAPHLWHAADRFIEAGDWLVWQLTGQEKRSLGFAAYKAQYQPGIGYPRDVVPGLLEKLSEPRPVGTAAGSLSAEWRERTGVRGESIVAIPVIDSHVVMPAAGAVETGTLVGALGTSAVFLLLDNQPRALPAGIEGVARDGVLPGFWCYEAGQAGFGDTLAWFVRTFPLAERLDENFAAYNAAAARLRPGENHLVALDWWNGCRVPLGDSAVSGLMLGMNLRTTGADLYRALLESLCFGARSIVDHLASGGAPIERVILTSGLARNNALLMQLMADILQREVQVPQIAHATAVGAAIHGAVAAGVVADYAEGARRWSAKERLHYRPAVEGALPYQALYEQYRELSQDAAVRAAMHKLNEVGTYARRRPLPENVEQRGRA
jgi:L-ribulokinase